MSATTVCYRENGFRTVPAEESRRRLEQLLLRIPVEVAFERRPLPGLPVTICRSRVLNDPDGRLKGKMFFGKGLSESQAMLSAGMEFSERLAAADVLGCPIVVSSYRELAATAPDPRSFVLADDTAYAEDALLQWVPAVSLRHDHQVLVPANLVFCPYEAPEPTIQIGDYDSNGLAAGNCVEEAILHGLLEVVERDAVMIAEYSGLPGPDVEIDLPRDDPIVELISRLEAGGTSVIVKDLTTDVRRVSTLAVFLSGPGPGDCALGAGTHLSPRIALSRSLTEAIQSYPRPVWAREWLAAGGGTRFSAPGRSVRKLGSLPESECGDVGDAVAALAGELEEKGITVYVARFRSPTPEIQVVRVLATALQPILNPGNPRVSRRLFEVPVSLGWRNEPLPRESLRLHEFIGYR